MEGKTRRYLPVRRRSRLNLQRRMLAFLLAVVMVLSNVGLIGLRLMEPVAVRRCLRYRALILWQPSKRLWQAERL